MTNEEKSKIQKEIVDSVSSEDSGRLLLAPRSGKTKVGIDIIKRDKPKSILWVTKEAKLAKEDIPKEFKTWKATRYLSKLQTSTWASLHKVEGIFDLIILDEDQHITERNSVNLFNGKLKGRIISMTGTPTKTWKKNRLYQKLKLEPLYKITITEAVDIGLLSNYSINVVSVDLSKELNIKAGNKIKNWMTSEEKQYQYVSSRAEESIRLYRKDAGFKIRNRMHFIHNSPSKYKVAEYLMKNLKGRKLIFCPNIVMAEHLSKYTFHSKTTDDDYKKFVKGEVDEISMVNSGGTGHTYKAIDHLILMQADSDKNGLTSQKISRTLLQQLDYKATVWIVCLSDTKDVVWTKSTLENFDKDKINYLEFEELIKSN